MVECLTTFTLALVSIHGLRKMRVKGRDLASADFILPHAEGSDHSATDVTVI